MTEEDTTMTEEDTTMTDKQRECLAALCARYGVPFHESDYRPSFELPAGWVAGWVGGDEHRLYVGCDPDGRISS